MNSPSRINYIFRQTVVLQQHRHTWMQTYLHLKSIIIFWDMTPYSPLSINRRFCLPPACLLGFAELISSTLKMEVICSTETSAETQRTTRRHIPEDDTLHNHRCENLKSYICVCH
jgi:hypothetical protein